MDLGDWSKEGENGSQGLGGDSWSKCDRVQPSALGDLKEGKSELGWKLYLFCIFRPYEARLGFSSVSTGDWASAQGSCLLPFVLESHYRSRN